MDGNDFIGEILKLLEIENTRCYDHKIVERIKKLSYQDFESIVENKYRAGNEALRRV